MKRDMELIRQILLAVESWPPEGGDRSFTALSYPKAEIEYNCYQAIQGGLLEGISTDTDDDLMCVVFRLTPEGHDFLNNARNQFIWDEVMAGVRAKGIVSASIDVMKQLLDRSIRNHLNDA